MLKWWAMKNCLNMFPHTQKWEEVWDNQRDSGHVLENEAGKCLIHVVNINKKLCLEHNSHRKKKKINLQRVLIFSCSSSFWNLFCISIFLRDAPSLMSLLLLPPYLWPLLLATVSWFFYSPGMWNWLVKLV